ncbi:MAG TPA: carboxyl transferase domain-containing protein [Gammaproteobacteria bacterium]|nr:carboxyl transferase domain-containing protein [Gammaproteobacteria bacterium]
MNNVSNQQLFLDDIKVLRALNQAQKSLQVKSFVQKGNLNRLLPYERVDNLMDSVDTCVPIAPYCGGLATGEHCGVLASLGLIANRPCVVVANDYCQKGGSLSPLGVDKILRCIEVAKKHRWPLVFLVESAGADLGQQSKVYTKTGRIYAEMARVLQSGVPILSVVHGSATAGGAYLPGMSSYVIMVQGAEAYLAGPPLVEAAMGQKVDGQALGGVDVHCQSGLVDAVAKDDGHALELVRQWVSSQNYLGCFEKLKEKDKKDMGEMLNLVAYDSSKPYALSKVFDVLFDEGKWDAFQSNNGTDTVTVWGGVGGHVVGVIGNQGPFSSVGARKAASFIQECDVRGVPVVFLQNTPGFGCGRDAEASGIIVAGSTLLKAVTLATVPKYVFIIGGSYGAGSYAMCSRAYDPSMIFAWPNSRLAVMGAQSVVGVMDVLARKKGKKLSKEKRQQWVERYERESHVHFTSSQLWDDGIIDPRLTRHYLILWMRFSTVSMRSTKVD